MAGSEGEVSPSDQLLIADDKSSDEDGKPDELPPSKVCTSPVENNAHSLDVDLYAAVFPAPEESPCIGSQILHDNNDKSMDLDLYTDLLAAESEQQQTAKVEAKEKLDEQVKLLEQLQSINSRLENQNKHLLRNISVLFQTAKTEINRKDKQIRELQERLDSMVFRRERRFNTPNLAQSDADSDPQRGYINEEKGNFEFRSDQRDTPSFRGSSSPTVVNKLPFSSRTSPCLPRAKESPEAVSRKNRYTKMACDTMPREDREAVRRKRKRYSDEGSASNSDKKSSSTKLPCVSSKRRSKIPKLENTTSPTVHLEKRSSKSKEVEKEGRSDKPEKVKSGDSSLLLKYLGAKNKSKKTKSEKVPKPAANDSSKLTNSKNERKQTAKVSSLKRVSCGNKVKIQTLEVNKNMDTTETPVKLNRSYLMMETGDMVLLSEYTALSDESIVENGKALDTELQATPQEMHKIDVAEPKLAEVRTDAMPADSKAQSSETRADSISRSLEMPDGCMSQSVAPADCKDRSPVTAVGAQSSETTDCISRSLLTPADCKLQSLETPSDFKPQALEIPVECKSPSVISADCTSQLSTKAENKKLNNVLGESELHRTGPQDFLTEKSNDKGSSSPQKVLSNVDLLSKLNKSDMKCRDKNSKPSFSPNKHKHLTKTKHKKERSPKKCKSVHVKSCDIEKAAIVKSTSRSDKTVNLSGKETQKKTHRSEDITKLKKVTESKNSISNVRKERDRSSSSDKRLKEDKYHTNGVQKKSDFKHVTSNDKVTRSSHRSSNKYSKTENKVIPNDRKHANGDRNSIDRTKHTEDSRRADDKISKNGTKYENARSDSIDRSRNSAEKKDVNHPHRQRRKSHEKNTTSTHHSKHEEHKSRKSNCNTDKGERINGKQKSPTDKVAKVKRKESSDDCIGSDRQKDKTKDSRHGRSKIIDKSEIKNCDKNDSKVTSDNIFRGEINVLNDSALDVLHLQTSLYDEIILENKDSGSSKTLSGKELSTYKTEKSGSLPSQGEPINVASHSESILSNSTILDTKELTCVKLPEPPDDVEDGEIVSSDSEEEEEKPRRFNKLENIRTPIKSVITSPNFKSRINSEQSRRRTMRRDDPRLLAANRKKMEQRRHNILIEKAKETARRGLGRHNKDVSSLSHRHMHLEKRARSQFVHSKHRSSDRERRTPVRYVRR